MLSIRLLDRAIDSLQITKDSLTKQLNKDIGTQLHYLNLPDSIWNKTKSVTPKKSTFLALIPDSLKTAVYDNAIGVVYSLKNSYQFSGTELENKRVDMRTSLIEWHRKLSLSFACLILFFIGAPLGSIIRKGGLGMPLVVAILFFLVFHLLNMFGEKFVKEGIATPFVGMWLAILVLGPLGVFLTYKAMHDSSLFNKEFYHRFFKSIRPFFTPIINRLNPKK